MQKVMIAAMLILTTLSLTSCIGNSRTAMLNRAGDSGKMDARSEQIVEAINSRDRDAIMAMFSEKALSEAEDIDGGIDYLFSLFENDIESWERKNGQVSENIDHGKKTKSSNWWISVISGGDNYSIYVSEDTIDTEHPENIGVYTIKAIHETDKIPKYYIGGIYVPFDEDGAAHARFEVLLKLIKDKDKTAIKALFSEEALSEARDIDGEIDKLLDLFPSGIDSWEQERGYAYREMLYSSQYINCIYVYMVYADEETYWIKIDEFLARTSMPESVGVGYIMICRPGGEHHPKSYHGINFPEE